MLTNPRTVRQEVFLIIGESLKPPDWLLRLLSERAFAQCLPSTGRARRFLGIARLSCTTCPATAWGDRGKDDAGPKAEHIANIKEW